MINDDDEDENDVTKQSGHRGIDRWSLLGWGWMRPLGHPWIPRSPYGWVKTLATETTQTR